MAVMIKVTGSSDVTPCSLVDTYQCFWTLQNVGTYQPNYEECSLSMFPMVIKIK
jgi:hypothetical protein